MAGVLAKGSLLVASPTLADPNFFRSVVFILAHDDEDGSLGVVLNRPSPIPVDEIVPGWGGACGHSSGAVHRGTGTAERGDLYRTHRVVRRGRTTGFAPSSEPRHGRPARGPRSTSRCRWPRSGSSPAMPAGGRDSSPTRSARDHGTCSRPRTRMFCRATPKGCGRGCFVVKAAGSPCSPFIPQTSPRTDLAVRA